MVKGAAPPGRQGLPILAPRAARTRLNVAALLIDASSYSFTIAIACHAESALAAGYWELGMLGALSAFLYSLVCLFSGGLSDRLGSMPIAFVALGGISAASIAGMFARTFTVLLLVGGAMGAALALFWPPIQRKLSLLSPGGTLRGALGKFNLYWAVGVALATLLTPGLYAAWGPSPELRLVGTLLVGLAVTVAAVPILAARMPEPAPEPGAATDPDAPPSPGRGRLFLHLAWIANFTVFFSMVGVMKVFPKISSDLRISLGAMGLVLSPLDIGKIAAFVVLARFAFWHYSMRWLFAAQGVAGAALVIAGLAEAWWVFAILFPAVGALSALTYYSSIYYGLNLREGEGRKSGLHETILSGGVCVGPLLCGFVGERFPAHPGAALVFGGAVILLGLAVQLGLCWIRREPPGASGEGPRREREAEAVRCTS